MRVLGRSSANAFSLGVVTALIVNQVVHIADSKTVNGIGDMPMTAAAREAFQRQIEEAPGSEYLFPSPKQKSRKPYMTNLLKGCACR
jgi:hypothetical protein